MIQYDSLTHTFQMGWTPPTSNDCKVFKICWSWNWYHHLRFVRRGCSCSYEYNATAWPGALKWRFGAHRWFRIGEVELNATRMALKWPNRFGVQSIQIQLPTKMVLKGWRRQETEYFRIHRNHLAFCDFSLVGQFDVRFVFYVYVEYTKKQKLETTTLHNSAHIRSLLISISIYRNTCSLSTTVPSLPPKSAFIRLLPFHPIS